MIEAHHEHASREKVISKSRSKKRPVAHIIVRVELPGERCPFCDDKIGLERDSTKEDWSQEAMPHHVFPILRMKSHSTGSSNFVEEPRIDRPQRSKRSKVNFLPPSIEIPPLIDIFPTSIIPPARPDPVIDLDQDAVTLSDFQLAPGKFHRHVAIHQERFALSAMSNLQSRLKPESETESVHSSTSITVVKGSETDSDVAGSNSSRSSLVLEDFGREMIAEESPWGDSNVENGWEVAEVKNFACAASSQVVMEVVDAGVMSVMLQIFVGMHEYVYDARRRWRGEVDSEWFDPKF
jgi:hypothetical protein